MGFKRRNVSSGNLLAFLDEFGRLHFYCIVWMNCVYGVAAAVVVHQRVMWVDYTALLSHFIQAVGVELFDVDNPDNVLAFNICYFQFFMKNAPDIFNHL